MQWETQDVETPAGMKGGCSGRVMDGATRGKELDTLILPEDGWVVKALAVLSWIAIVMAVALGLKAGGL